MTVADIRNVELVALRDDPEGLGTLNVRGKPIVGYSCLPNGSCEVSVFGGKVPAVTVNTLPNGRGLKAVEVQGSDWFTWDNNADGQFDTRTSLSTNKVEIWIDGHWVPVTIAGSGKSKKYFVDGREAVFAPNGWAYSGT